MLLSVQVAHVTSVVDISSDHTIFRAVYTCVRLNLSKVQRYLAFGQDITNGRYENR
jgi:hypothetical protein